MKRKAFTLIELMVAVVVIAILMSIVFRLSGTGSDSQKRNLTASRLQRLENCLSGYYAAFGSYPQVPMQRNSRDFRLHVDEYGVQDQDQTDSSLRWENVQAACRAQPVGTLFPFRQDMHEYIVNIAKQLQKKASSNEERFKSFKRKQLVVGFDDGTTNKRATLLSEDTVFEFGLMSFLLPRYYFMLGCDSDFLKRSEWTDNNVLPSDPENGLSINGGWEKFRDWGFDSDGKMRDSSGDQWKYAMVPSQSVCARWMPNLEGSCRVLTAQKFFGISISDGSASALSAENPGVADMIRYPDPENPGKNGYVLNSITILDGWGNEFYYYSAPPYQNYTIWSAGPNGKTFCPWVPLNTLNSSEATTAGNWMADDIIQMGH